MLKLLSDHPDILKESAESVSPEEDSRDRPLIARQTSLKELPSASRKSCEAIPEESKEAEANKTDDSTDLQPVPRDRVYTMPALNVQRRPNPDAISRRSMPNADSAQKESSATSGTNPR